MDLTPFNICLVDDDRIYQFTAKKIIESTGLTQTVLSFFNGEDAINYLKNSSENNQPIPDIIFLDINMVISSVDDYDIKKSKEYSFVTDYIIKPINRERFEQLILSARKK
jgi:two-component SAPR family response regulator